MLPGKLGLPKMMKLKKPKAPKPKNNRPSKDDTSCVSTSKQKANNAVAAPEDLSIWTNFHTQEGKCPDFLLHLLEEKSFLWEQLEELKIIHQNNQL